MRDFCNRDASSGVSVPSTGSREMVERYKRKFLKEAAGISRQKHPNIVRVVEVFEENNTAYYVMEYIEGYSLEQWVKEKGALPESEAFGYICQIASALDYIHAQKMTHLDVKPGNILLKEEGEALLIDFGLAKQYDEAGDQTSSTPVGFSKGYAPIEQTRQGGVGEFSPPTDIYALGATLYRLLTGQAPPDAADILNAGLPQLPSHISRPTARAIEKAMNPVKSYRPQTIPEFLSLLTSTGDVPPTREKKNEETKVIIDPPKYEPPTYVRKGEETKLLIDSEPEMVFVQGGVFTMGRKNVWFSDEGPAHQVTLSGFSIGKYEVTQKQWQAVMGSNPSGFKGDNLPVENVSWNDVQSFIRKLNELTGKRYRLPTEAEWEYAARGGNQSRGYKYSGSNTISSVAWYDGNSGSKTHPVGQKQGNELGIYDMTGNVWEWCSDWKDAYSSSSQTNPTGPSSSRSRVDRGGGWSNGARRCRVASRNGDTPSYSNSNLGFRLVLP
jgi:formylglycine-generating enzyme required for sulfatase activity